MQTSELTLEEEGILKKVLLTDAFELELQKFASASDPYDFLINHTILLRLLFGTLVGDKEPHPSVRKLILKTPRILSLIHKATKKKDTTASYFAAVLDLLIRTPKEKQYAAEVGDTRRFSDLVRDNVAVRRIEGEDERLFEAASSARQQIIDSALNMYQDVSTDPRGTDRLFDEITRAKTRQELPPSWQGMFGAMSTAVLPRVNEIIKDDTKLQTRKKMYHNFPRRTVTTILTYTNPFKMVSSLSSLFFARPLGAHNLAQKQMETMTEYPRTLAAIKAAKKDLPAKYTRLCDRIESYAKNEYEPLGDSSFSEEDNAQEEKEAIIQKVDLEEQKRQLEEALFSSSNAGKRHGHSLSIPHSFLSHGHSPSSSTQLKDDYSHMSDAEVSQLFRVLRLEKRRRDKEDIIDLFGDPEMIEVIKDILPMICVPLGDIYARVGVSDWVGSSFKWLKCLCEVGERFQKGAIKSDEAARDLQAGFDLQLDAHYRFLRNIVTADQSGTFKDLARWIFAKFQVGDGCEIDLNRLMRDQDPAIRDELGKLMAFEQFRNHMWKADFKKAYELKRPEHPIITSRLLGSFLQQLQCIPLPTFTQPKKSPMVIKAISSPPMVRKSPVLVRKS